MTADKLRDDGMDAYRRGHVRRPYIAQGLDQQGRVEAAHASTEVGADDDQLRAARGIVVAVICALAAMALLSALWISFGGSL